MEAAATDNSAQIARKLAVHTALDQIFAANYDLSRLPGLMSEIGSRSIGCEFISMWLYDPTENTMVNIVARQKIHRSAGEGQEIPAGKIRLKVEKGNGKGVLPNLAADVLEGKSFEELDQGLYIINDRFADPRLTHNQHPSMDLVGIDNEIYAPMVFNGFKGMLCALNHQDGKFNYDDWEILKILASKAAILVDNIEARRKADEASRLAVLGKALDLVRHELAAPLTAIKGASSIIVSLLEGGAPSAAQIHTVLELARIIPPEVDRNVQTLREIREYAKPRLEIPLTQGDLNDFLRSSVETIRDAISGNREQTSIELKLDDNLPEVRYSAHHMLAVLRNLVRNSAGQGSSEVEIVTSVRTVTVPDTHITRREIVLEVCDRGGGVDEEKLAALFHPYETTKGHAGGSGLGLFICRRLIEEGHGGRISAHNIYSKEGRVGLCVSMHLPVD